MPCGMLRAATTPRLRLPQLSTAEALLLLAGRRTTKGAAIPIPKVVLLLAQIFSLFKTRAMACVSFITFTATKHTRAFSPAPIRKTKVLPNPYRFSGKFNTCHCHSHALTSKCRHNFSNGRVNKRKVLGGHWGNIKCWSLHVPCRSSGPLLKGTDGQPIPSWGFV